jgi:hypothetical protein
MTLCTGGHLMSVSKDYSLIELNLSKLPEDLREFISKPERDEEYIDIFFYEDTKPVERHGKDVQLLFLHLIENKKPLEKGMSNHGFVASWFSSNDFTYPLEEFFESIKL